MSIRAFTYRHLNITPLRVKTSLSLDALVIALRGKRYDPNNLPSSGFGGLPFEAEEDAEPAFRRAQVGRPRAVSVGPDKGPKHKLVIARYAWDVPNEGLISALDGQTSGLTPAQLNLTDCVDVMLADYFGHKGEVLALVPTHDERELERVHAALTSAIGASNWAAQGFAIIRPADAKDFFLWMASRALARKNLVSGVSVTDFRELNADAPGGRRMKASRGVGMDRLDVLAALAQEHELGPVKVTLDDTATKLTVDLQLLNDGSFDIHRGGSEYVDQPGRASFGLRVTRDVAVDVLPRVVAAYRSDSTWNVAARKALAKDAAKRVVAVLK